MVLLNLLKIKKWTILVAKLDTHGLLFFNTTMERLKIGFTTRKSNRISDSKNV